LLLQVTLTNKNIKSDVFLPTIGWIDRLWL